MIPNQEFCQYYRMCYFLLFMYRDQFDKEMKVQPKQKYPGDQSFHSRRPDRKTYSTPTMSGKSSYSTNSKKSYSLSLFSQVIVR